MASSRPGDGHERGTARGHQPLVRGGGDDAEARRVERQPAGGLRGVDDGQHVVHGGSARDRVEVGDLTGGHLDRAEGGDVRVLVDRVRQIRGRDDANVELGPDHEREQRRGELDVGDHDARAARQ